MVVTDHQEKHLKMKPEKEKKKKEEKLVEGKYKLG